MKDEVKVTHQDIVDRLQALHALAPVDQTETVDLYSRLPFEMAQPFLPFSVKREDFERDASQLKPPLATCSEYLEFAWHKANDARALSVLRSLGHMRAWLFLAGLGDIVQQHFTPPTAQEVPYFGKQQLLIASLLCQFPWQKHDDDEWRDMNNPFKVLGGLQVIRLQQEAYTIVRAALDARKST